MTMEHTKCRKLLYISLGSSHKVHPHLKTLYKSSFAKEFTKTFAIFRKPETETRTQLNSARNNKRFACCLKL